MAADHRRLEALLDRSTATPGTVDPDLFEQFRAGLLRHIALEEKILLPAILDARGGDPHPIARQLRLDHGAIAAMLVPTPTAAGVARLRALLELHDEIEERAGGVYDDCDRALAPSAAGLVDRLKAYPNVRTAPHVDGPLVERHIQEALARAGRVPN
jgi:hypothetical protein